jgi:hypothetical protein
VPIVNAEVALVGKDQTAQAFRNLVRNAEVAGKQIEGKFKSTFSLLAKGFAAFQLGRLVLDAAAAGDEMLALAARTGRSVESLSQLDFVARRSGTSLDALISGQDALAQKLGATDKEGKKVTKALTEIGLSANTIRALSPNEQLDAIADAMTGVTDPTARARLELTLMGVAGTELDPILRNGADGIRELREEADRLGVTMTELEAKRLAKLDAQLEDTAAQFNKLKLEIAGVIAQPIGAYFELLSKGLMGWRVMLGVTGVEMEELNERTARLIQERNKLQDEQRHIGESPRRSDRLEAIKVEIELIREKQEYLTREAGITARLEADLARIRTKKNQLSEEELKKITADFDKAIESVETPTENLMRVFEEAREAFDKMLAVAPEKAGVAKEALVRLAVETQDAIDALARPENLDSIKKSAETLLSSVATPAEQIRKKFQDAQVALAMFTGAFPEKAAEAQQALERLAVSAQDALDDLSGRERLDEIRSVGDALIQSVERPIETQKRLFAEAKTALGEYIQAFPELAPQAEEALRKIELGIGQLSVFAEQAARNIQDAFADFLFDPFDDGIRGMLSGFTDAIRRMAANVAAAHFFESTGLGAAITSILGGAAGASGVGSSGVPKYKGPAAEGMSLKSGEWAIAGEKGREPVFGPATIVPFKKLGGQGQQVTNVTVQPVYNIDNRGATVDAMKALPAILERNNQVMKADIVSTIITGIQRRRYNLGT